MLSDYYYYTRLTASFQDSLVSRYQKCKTSLDLNEARDGKALGSSGISWNICKQSAPRCRQIPHQHLITQFLQTEYSS